jgi:hypothetical protein
VSWSRKDSSKFEKVTRGDISTTPKRVGPQSEWKTGGIGDRRIGDPEDVSPIHFSFAKYETSIGERTVVLWTSWSHIKRVSQRS